MRTVILLALYPVAACIAQLPGAFTATGNMMAPRAAHTATLLRDGRVLIAGGYLGGPDDSLTSAELYDPSTGGFTSTGSMTTPRAFHAATLLADGRVLIVGGGAGASAELYDPATGQFTAAGAMAANLYPQPQAGTLLPDGRVLIAGYPTAQLYDPATNGFATTAPYATLAPPFIERSTLLADGRVLLTGGIDDCYSPLCADPGAAWTELYDPVAGTFSPAGSIHQWDNVYTATLLADGSVLFVGSGGGAADAAGISAAEIFDPSSGTFTPIGSAAASHGYGASTLLPDGTVLITGGIIPGGDGEIRSELYLPASTSFSPAGNMMAGRELNTATLLADGTVLIAGGFNGPPPTASAEIYHPAVLVTAPLLFSLSGDGHGQGAIWHAATGEVATEDSPAVAGEALSMYTTSLGDGSVIPPQVAIGGRLAGILFFGSAPGYQGINQVNVRVPGGVAPGASIPVCLTYLGRPSNQVTLGVQ
jgi:large repetitive protein